MQISAHRFRLLFQRIERIAQRHDFIFRLERGLFFGQQLFNAHKAVAHTGQAAAVDMDLLFQILLARARVGELFGQGGEFRFQPGDDAAAGLFVIFFFSENGGVLTLIDFDCFFLGAQALQNFSVFGQCMVFVIAVGAGLVQLRFGFLDRVGEALFFIFQPLQSNLLGLKACADFGIGLTQGRNIIRLRMIGFGQVVGRQHFVSDLAFSLGKHFFNVHDLLGRGAVIERSDHDFKLANDGRQGAVFRRLTRLLFQGL